MLSIQTGNTEKAKHVSAYGLFDSHAVVETAAAVSSGFPQRDNCRRSLTSLGHPMFKQLRLIYGCSLLFQARVVGTNLGRAELR